MRRLALIICVLLLASCKNSEVLFGQGKIKSSSQSSIRLPIEIDRNLIFLPVEINGETYRFLFDSGAPMVVSKELREALEMKIVKRSQVRDSQGRAAYQNYVRMPSFKLGGEEFRDFVAVEADLKHSPLLNCLQFDGIVGANLMQFKYWEMNIRDSLLIMSADKTNWDFGGRSTLTIPFTLKTTRTPVIKLPISGYQVRSITFDTGSSGLLSLPKKSSQVLIDSLSPVFSRQGFLSGGLYGSVADTSDEYMVEFQFPDTTFSYPVEYDYSKNSRLLGMSFMRQFRVFIDYPARQIKLIPISDYEQGEIWPLSPYYKDFIIVGQTNSLLDSAGLAGLALGDTIISCNDVDYSSPSKDDFCRIIEQFSAPGDSLKIEVKGKGLFTIFRKSAY